LSLGTAIFFVLALFLLNLAIPALPAHSGERGVMGGPADFDGIPPILSSNGEKNGFLEGHPGVEPAPVPGVDKAFIATESMKNQGGLYGTPDLVSYSSGAGGVISYSVKNGDTPASIAASYGITTQTLIASNPALKKKSIKSGQLVQILPVSGVLHKVADGETLVSVAQLYNVSKDNVREFNSGIELDNLLAGTSLVIPGVANSKNSNSNSGNDSSSTRGYFRLPAEGVNWGTLHSKNAVDIANICGTPIFASAEGLVIAADSVGWNNGYGSFVTIEHPIGTKTKYAHLERVGVEVGNYIKQGDVIGDMGQTGDATGCHLHFEIEGAKNPFVK